MILGANHTYPWKKSLGRQTGAEHSRGSLQQMFTHPPPRINPIESDATSLLSAPCTPQLDKNSGISDHSILSPKHAICLHQPQVFHIPKDSTNCFRHHCRTRSAGADAVAMGAATGHMGPVFLGRMAAL